MKTFSVLITTKDRIKELKFTLQKIKQLIDREGVECIICNDGSSDETSEFVEKYYPEIKLIEHAKSKGLIASRNELLALTKANYAITLDDDANFITENTLDLIAAYFKSHQYFGVLAFRIYWGMEFPKEIHTSEIAERVRSFVGCAHVWRMEAWKSIPNYPEWFIFYGEEDFAAFQLFKKGWEVHYVPEILVHHRVDLKARKKEKDYRLRLRRSLRSGWYLYMMFFPWQEIPRRFSYTLWVQIKNKVFKGDWKAILAITQAMGDVIINLPRLLSNSNRLTEKEFKAFNKLSDTKLYWTSNDN